MNWFKRLIEPDTFESGDIPNRFSSLFPYLAYDESDNIFENENSYGFVLEVTPQIGADMEMARVLNTLLMLGWPADTGIQVSLYGSPNIRSRLAEWANIRQGTKDESEDRLQGVYRTLARKRVGFWLGGTTRSLFKSAPYLLKNMRCFISFTLPGQLNAVRRQLVIDLQKSAISTLGSAHLPAYAWSASDLITTMGEILNQEDTPQLAYDSGKLIKNQIINHDTSFKVYADKVLINDDTEVRMMSVKNYPEEFPLWDMNNLIGDMFQRNRQFTCPFMLTLGIHLPDLEAAKSGAQLKAARATNDSESQMAKFMPDFALKKRDYDILLHALSEGHSMCQLYHQLMLFPKKGEGSQAEQAARAMFRAKNWELTSDHFIQVPGILGSMPMMLDKKLWADYKRLERYSTKTTGNATHLSPVLADWRGTGTPTLKLFSRRGQDMNFDFYDNTEGNYNVAIAAASGSGKSFFINEIVTSYRAQNGRVWIIDVGRSYEKLCHLLGGEFIEFTPDNSPNMNPFTNVQDFNEEMPVLKGILSKMASPNQELSSIQGSMIESAIQAAWQEKGNQSTPTTVAQCLSRMDDPRAQDLATMLKPFTASGVYGRYFEGPNTLDFNNKLVVLELEELKTKKDLQSVVLMILMAEIQNKMYLSDRAEKKVCIIDEAWDLMAGSTGEFLETGYRRARKYGGLFVTATQSVGDYYKNAAALAAFENSDWILLLRQKKESVEQLERSGRMLFDASMKKSLLSLSTSHNEFSEVFVYSPMGQGIGRLIVDPYSAQLYSSKGEEYQIIKDMMDNGVSIEDALDRVMEKKGVH